MTDPARYRAADLETFATALLGANGFDAERAGRTAALLLEADLMGHDTHGLLLLPSYLTAADRDELRRDAAVEVLADAPAASVWNANYAPGLWVTERALATAAEKARACGTASISIRRCGHIGCLAAFLPGMAEQRLMAIVASSDPSGAYVAPYGGCEAVFSPNPIAVVIPTPGDPIMIDTSASMMTVGMTRRMAAAGEHAAEPAWLDAAGEASSDPAAMDGPPAGSILPTGGTGHGHKGYGFALMIEAMTQALSGFGRLDAPTVLGASVFVQVFDPALFGGYDDFVRQSGWLADACRASAPRPEVAAVRLPGDQAIARRRAALAEGVRLHPAIMPALARCAGEAGVPCPAPLGG